MNEAVEHQAAATRQAVADAYRGQLRLVRARLASAWQSRAQAINAEGTPNAAVAFKALVASRAADSVIVLGNARAPAYPALLRADVQPMDPAASEEQRLGQAAVRGLARAGQHRAERSMLLVRYCVQVGVARHGRSRAAPDGQRAPVADQSLVTRRSSSCDRDPATDCDRERLLDPVALGSACVPDGAAPLVGPEDIVANTRRRAPRVELSRARSSGRDWRRPASDCYSRGLAVRVNQWACRRPLPHRDDRRHAGAGAEGAFVRRGRLSPDRAGPPEQRERDRDRHGPSWLGSDLCDQRPRRGCQPSAQPPQQVSLGRRDRDRADRGGSNRHWRRGTTSGSARVAQDRPRVRRVARAEDAARVDASARRYPPGR